MATRHFFDLLGQNGAWAKQVIHSDIDALDDEQFSVFVRRLALLVDKLNIYRPSTAVARQVGKRAIPAVGTDAAILKSMEMVARWPASLEELLAPFTTKGMPFIPDRRLFVWMRDCYLTDLFREVPACYRVISQALIELGSRLGDDLSLRRREEVDGLQTIEQIMRDTKLPRRLVVDIVKAQGWKTVSRLVGAKKFVYVKRSDVEDWLQGGGNGCINYAQAAELLGIGGKAVRALVSRGVLGKRAQAAARLRSPVLPTRSDVRDLVQRLERQRLGKARKTRYSATNCPGIRRSDGKVRTCSIAYLVETVALGKLRYWGEASAPLRWHFHEGDFDALNGTDTVSLKEASRIVGFSPGALKHATTLGLISIEKDDRGRELLGRSNVLTFAEEYCSSKQIRRANGMTPAQLYNQIRKAGIKMINLNGTLVMRRAVAVKHGVIPTNKR